MKETNVSYYETSKCVNPGFFTIVTARARLIIYLVYFTNSGFKCTVVGSINVMQSSSSNRLPCIKVAKLKVL